MTQSDLFVANAAGSVVRADINTIVEALATKNAGVAEPDPMFPNMWWADTGNSLLKKRNNANTTWTTVGPLDDILDVFGDFATVAEVLAGTESAKTIAPDTLYGLWKKGSDITSASSLSLPSTGGSFFTVTGTTTVAGISTAPAGRRVALRFASALQLTHNGTSFILPSSQNYNTVAGDVWEFVSLGSGNWVCVNVLRSAGGAGLTLAASKLVGRTDGSAGTPQEITLGTGLSMSGTTLNATATSPFSAAFTSSGQAISAGALRTMAHGLGGIPSLVQLQLHCTSADVGYSPGDIVIINHTSNGGGGDQSHALYIDATNVYIRCPSSSNGLAISNKSTGVATGIDFAKWQYVVKAWR